MHLFVGFILASLLKKKSSSGSVLPVVRGTFEAQHALPGRIRFRVPMLETAADGHIEAMQTELSKVPQIHSVKVSPASGSVLVTYDDNRIEPQMVCAVLIKVLGLERVFETSPESAVQKEINIIGNALNQAVYNRTAGAMDLASAMILVTLGLGLYKLLVVKDRSLPGGFNLLWWAYVMARSRK